MKAIRAVVSGSRVRYTKDGYDLDLTYITSRLIAMGYPATGMEKTYRNDISEVATFLNSHHPKSYRVFNLSERKYDYTRFENRVSDCGFPDHHPPPLQLLFDIVNEMLAFTAQNPKNVVVVHCLAGKGRTGVVCSCFLLLTGVYGDIFKLDTDRELREIANFAIKDFWDARGQGVRYPSQALYIYYFIRVVRRLGKMPRQIPALRPARKLLLKSVVLYGIPDYEAGGCTPFLQVLPAPSQHYKPELLYNSAWHNPNFDTYAADPRGSIMFEINCVVQGDVLIRCFHANTMSILGRHVVQMFHITFHTDFFRKQCDVYRLPKLEVDEAHDNARFPLNFCLDCSFGPAEDENEDEDDAIVNEAVDEIVDLASNASTIVAEPRRRVTVSHEPRQRSPVRAPVVSPVAGPTRGWLFKQGGFVRNWKKRWFVARDGQLTYYTNVSDPTPLGVVDLRNVHVDVCQAEETTAKNQRLHFFKLVPKHRDQRVWFFGAESEQEMIKWVRALAKEACRGMPGFPNDRRNTVAHIDSVGALQRNNTFAGYRHSDPLVHEPCLALRRNSSSTAVDMLGSNKAMRGSLGPVGFWRNPATSTSAGESSKVAHVPGRDSSRGSPYDLDDLNDVVSAENLVRSGNVPSFIRSKPLKSSTSISDKDRMTVLNEVADEFHLGVYIYTADELEAAARMQKHINTAIMDISSGPRPRPRTIRERLEQARLGGEREFIEQVLTEIVVLHFPTLVDAMECNPLQFIELILGTEIQSITESMSVKQKVMVL
ncbi:hypothetical protein Poli38472_008813 [Pythium oligandrum]|uniref:Phosphatidylinositol-3,4,5-trisphosphate 3-phosphatase n=1 Tax=Pythium oligandrum TaxID=41045 RepID=A0A8K1C4C2_PYTOL|nr:hypothetical protein Poli38472_008813 [Pythium oligandrum]|eukprot:TMW56165.1 hypothetical protein Poli38472_008813 [Pythium oligandrum]